MQRNDTKNEENLMKEMEDLIISIKSRVGSLKEEDLAVSLGYNQGYFSQVRSRGVVPKKFIDTLKRHLISLQNANRPASPQIQVETEPDHLSKLAEAALQGQQNIARMITMLEERDKYLKEIQSSLALVQPNMLALTAKIQEGQREIVAELGKKLDKLAAGTSHSSKSLPHAQR